MNAAPALPVIQGPGSAMPSDTSASMKQGVPWSVKGVGPDARETAKEAARRAGMTLGECLNPATASGRHKPPPPRAPASPPGPPPGPPEHRLSRLIASLRPPEPPRPQADPTAH